MALIAAQRGGMKLALPFGTFLAIGALVAMFVGEPLIDWYAGFCLSHAALNFASYALLGVAARRSPSC